MSATTTKYDFLEVGYRIRVRGNRLAEVVSYEKINIGNKDGKELGYIAIKTKPIKIIDRG